MNKITIYEYNKKNRRYFTDELESDSYIFMSIPLSDNINIDMGNLPDKIKGIFFDVSPFFRENDNSIIYCSLIEKLIDKMNDIEQRVKSYLVIDKRYSSRLKDLLFFRIKEIESLEKAFHLKILFSKNIVDIGEEYFNQILTMFNSKLVGQKKFKNRLEQELRKYRVFNKLGYQPIFSVLICGKSGIGKTEVARIFASCLSPDEPLIKINFGNYSDQNALSSLIGSPRGYIGSNSGELSDKLTNSDAKIILIDEFEKSNKQVQNFFLQLLEDGIFTDSLGRDYDLNKYMIVFTANLLSERIPEEISPELLSRFNFKYSFSELSVEDKDFYIEKRVTMILQDVEKEFGISIASQMRENILDIDSKNYANMRDINGELMKRISEVIYPEIYE